MGAGVPAAASTPSYVTPVSREIATRTAATNQPTKCLRDRCDKEPAGRAYMGPSPTRCSDLIRNCPRRQSIAMRRNSARQRYAQRRESQAVLLMDASPEGRRRRGRGRAPRRTPTRGSRPRRPTGAATRGRGASRRGGQCRGRSGSQAPSPPGRSGDGRGWPSPARSVSSSQRAARRCRGLRRRTGASRRRTRHCPLRRRPAGRRRARPPHHRRST